VSGYNENYLMKLPTEKSDIDIITIFKLSKERKYMKIDTYLLMGEKEFFDTMKKYNRYLTSKERHILVVVAERFIKLKEKGQD
jgi:hypothetical protein